MSVIAGSAAAGEVIQVPVPGEGLRPSEVFVDQRALGDLAPYADPRQMADLAAAGERAAARLAGRVVWHVNSTARGGGVAEMLHGLVGYVRGAGVDCRWLTIEGAPEFFRITKRLHHRMHGAPGDGGPLGPAERRVYDAVIEDNLGEIAALVREDDIVILHDPQVAGLIGPLADAGARVVWRSHVGYDADDPSTGPAWRFICDDVRRAHATVFSRRAYVPECGDGGRAHVIPPAIDPGTPKNQELPDGAVRAILVRAGIVEGPPGPDLAVFRRHDGSPGRVDRAADIVRLGRAPRVGTPLVVQISRWDPLKDHLGVMRAFAHLATNGDPRHLHLVLAGPCVTGVADDPEAPAVFEQVLAAWRGLPHRLRHRVQLASLPMHDAGENAAIVNALQRHATIVVQKSLREGFGLTVSEAMWKGRAVVASAVGGIIDQIEDARSGVLLEDPTDTVALADALADLARNPEARERLGREARRRVRERFLFPRQLADWAALIEAIDR